MNTRFLKSVAAVAVMLGATTISFGFDLPWSTIDGGGGRSAGGGFELAGTTGQSDAGSSAGDAFELSGGFWGSSDADEPCFGDLDGDDVIGLSDLAQLLANYAEPAGMTYDDGDLDGDGDVDLSDLAELLAKYGTSCS